MPFTKAAIETFISPKITAITRCDAADLSCEFPNASQWVSAFGLMVIFTNRPHETMRPFALQFIRRTEMAIAEFSLMRAELENLIAGNRQWSPYYRALHHGEVATAMLYQAYELSRKKLGTKLYLPKDGSPLQRLSLIYNTSKHQVAVSSDTLWLSNEGFHIEQVTLMFSEFENLARSCARIAHQMTST